MYIKSVKSRIFLIFIVFLFTISINSIWSVINFRRLNNSIERILDSNYKSIVAAQKMIASIERQDSLQLSYLFTKERGYIKNFTINKKEFLDCIDRATLLVREGEKKPIIIEITDNSMELRIDSAMGSMNENIDIDKEGKDILIGFNPRFLIDALKVIDDETISIYLVNPKAPCFIRDDEENYTYLILPVNINQNQAR